MFDPLFIWVLNPRCTNRLQHANDLHSCCNPYLSCTSLSVFLINSKHHWWTINPTELVLQFHRYPGSGWDSNHHDNFADVSHLFFRRYSIPYSTVLGCFSASYVANSSKGLFFQKLEFVSHSQLYFLLSKIGHWNKRFSQLKFSSLQANVH